MITKYNGGENMSYEEIMEQLDSGGNDVYYTQWMNLFFMRNDMGRLRMTS